MTQDAFGKHGRRFLPESVDGGAGGVCGALGRARVERLAAQELGPSRILVPFCAAASSSAHEVEIEAALVCAYCTSTLLTYLTVYPRNVEDAYITAAICCNTVCFLFLGVGATCMQ